MISMIQQPLSYNPISSRIAATLPSSQIPTNDDNNIEMDDGNGIRKITCDHVSVCLHCSADNTYFLSFVQPSAAYTFLGIQPEFGESWKKTIESIFHNVGLTNIKCEGIIHLNRWCIPGYDKTASHAVYLVSIESEDLKKLISEKFPGFWASTANISEAQKEWRLFSPEIYEIITNVNENRLMIKTATGTELTYNSLFVGLEPNKPKKTGFEQVIEAAQFGKTEQELLFKEYMHYTCPFAQMGWVSFISFMKELGWPEAELPDLFRAFDISSRGGLTYRDFLYGLAAAEPGTQHGGAPAEIRCRYIFRFYDRNNDSRISIDEFKTIVSDIQRMKGLQVDLLLVEQETQRCFKLFGDITLNSFSLTNFLTAVGQLKFRGTSHLMRSPISIPIYLKTRGQADVPVQMMPKKSKMDIESMNFSYTDDLGVAGQNLAENSKKYGLANHTIRVRRSGTLLDVNSITGFQTKSHPSHPGPANNAIFSGSNNPQEQRIELGRNAQRVISFDRFNQESQPNEMLNGLKYFARDIPQTKKTKHKPEFDWGEVDRVSLAKCLITLCHQVREIMLNEPRLLEIPAPCYILGDLHGNFPDLMCFEKALWRLGPMLTPASLLFLGDYVDRGIYGVEVVSYLFAQKILSPIKFNLLRGNHEIRNVQQMFTFYRECITKFGEKIGREVWEEVNLAFDCMPLAAVVDKNVFCVHGGIPPPWIGDGFAREINSIPVPLSNPEDSSPLAWDLMWSDPEHLEEMSPEEKIKFAANPKKYGFGMNLKRGTGHTFSEAALERFLNKNNFSHVVRAHEVQQSGFQVQHGGKLLTVFSSSKYCGGSNEAACILADKLKLRSIRIDTTS